MHDTSRTTPNVDIEDILDYSTGSVTRYTTSRPKGSELFLHSGFGSGNSVDPVPGTYIKTSISQPFGRVEARDLYSATTYSGTLVDRWGCTFPTFPEPPAASTVRTKCLGKLYSALRQGDTLDQHGSDPTNLAVDVGEREETLELLHVLRHPLRSLVEETRYLANALSNTDPSAKFADRPIGRLTGRLAKYWLTYKLALAPTLEELKNLSNFHLTKPTSDIQRVKSRASATDHYSGTDVSVGITRNYDIIESTRVEIGIEYVIPSPNLYDLSRLTSLCPLSTAYELTTLSFVVDWVVGIGEYLRILEGSFAPGVTMVRGYETTTTRAQQVCRFSASGPFGSYSDILLDGRGSYVYTTKSRLVLVGWPIAALPRFKQPFSFGSDRVLTAGALLAVAGKVGNLR